MGLNRTSEKKVFVVRIFSQLLYSISSISKYNATQLDIQVKSYCRETLLTASIFNYERLDLLRDSIRHPNKSYCRLNFLKASLFIYERLDILRYSIGLTSEMVLSFEFATSIGFKFRASRYITGLNRTSE